MAKILDRNARIHGATVSDKKANNTSALIVTVDGKKMSLTPGLKLRVRPTTEKNKK